MQDRNSLHPIDQSILQCLSQYEDLTPLQLWYELGENNAMEERITEEELARRLESLRERGFVERVAEEGVDSLPVYRIKMRDDQAGSGGTETR